jgi:hypothetical protein
MAWRCTVEKYHPTMGEYWTNVYILDASSMAEAETSAAAITAAERVFHTQNVLFTKWRVDDGIEDTDVYKTKPLNVYGQRSQGSDLLALFNVLRVDFETAGGGTPSRKYYRGVLQESDCAGNRITDGSLLTLAQNAFSTSVTGDLVDPDGQIFESVTASPMVGMRQLRRGSKKKNTQSTPST